MATNNTTITVGYLMSDPVIKETEICLDLRTVCKDSTSSDAVCIGDSTTSRRESGLSSERPDSLHSLGARESGKHFARVPIMYDAYEENDRVFEKIKKLRAFDLIFIKGVFNTVVVNRPSICPHCGQENTDYQKASPFIRPISLFKISSGCNDETLMKYQDFSNIMWILGTLCKDPKMIERDGHPVCQYLLWVKRKFYVKTQPDTTSDYLWVYTYDDQAIQDYKTLKQGDKVFVNGYFSPTKIQVSTKCDSCGAYYQYSGTTMHLHPYFVSYLVYRTKEEIAMEKSLKKDGLKDEEIRDLVRRRLKGQHDFKTPVYNLAILTGYVAEEPKTFRDGRINVILQTIHREAKNVGKGAYSTINLLTHDPDALNLHKFDLITAIGEFKEISHSVTRPCPNCGTLLTIPIASHYFAPSSFFKICNLEDENQANEAMADEYREMGNFMWELATLTEDPIYLQDNGEYTVYSDTPQETTVVRSYGEQATDDAKHLQKDSGIFIDGYFQSVNQLPHTMVCPDCGEAIKYSTKEPVLIPYAIEYLDYITDKDIEDAKTEHSFLPCEP